MEKKITIAQHGDQSLEIVATENNGDLIQVWSEKGTRDPQVIFIERKNIETFCEALKTIAGLPNNPSINF